MQFRKIDEHKIHCIISQEEMSQKGIQIEDFLDHRDKTEAFLREILAEAKYELNLDEDMGRCFSVQMAVSRKVMFRLSLVAKITVAPRRR